MLTPQKHHMDDLLTAHMPDPSQKVAEHVGVEEVEAALEGHVEGFAVHLFGDEVQRMGELRMVVAYEDEGVEDRHCWRRGRCKCEDAAAEFGGERQEGRGVF